METGNEMWEFQHDIEALARALSAINRNSFVDDDESVFEMLSEMAERRLAKVRAAKADQQTQI